MDNDSVQSFKFNTLPINSFKQEELLANLASYNFPSTQDGGKSFYPRDTMVPSG